MKCYQWNVGKKTIFANSSAVRFEKDCQNSLQVKYIEFYPDFTWGTIGMESSAACTVLLEHAKNHPFKPEGTGSRSQFQEAPLLTSYVLLSLQAAKFGKWKSTRKVKVLKTRCYRAFLRQTTSCATWRPKPLPPLRPQSLNSQKSQKWWTTSSSRARWLPLPVRPVPLSSQPPVTRERRPLRLPRWSLHRHHP